MRTLSIGLPDPLFDEAVREAAASSRSVEESVAEMIREGLHVTDEDAPLTPEQIEKIRQAQTQIAAGDSFTTEEVEAHFKVKTTAWSVRLSTGTLHGSSLPGKALRSEAIYAEGV